MNKVISDIGNEQSAYLDIEIRNLCREYGFEPEDIYKTNYRLCVETTPTTMTEKGISSITSVHLTKIHDSREFKIEGKININ